MIRYIHSFDRQLNRYSRVTHFLARRCHWLVQSSIRLCFREYSVSEVESLDRAHSASESYEYYSQLNSRRKFSTEREQSLSKILGRRLLRTLHWMDSPLRAKAFALCQNYLGGPWKVEDNFKGTKPKYECLINNIFSIILN